MTTFKAIESLADLDSVFFLHEGRADDPVWVEISAVLAPGCAVARGTEDELQRCSSGPPAIVFVGPPDHAASPRKFARCRELRAGAYGGIVVLVTDDLGHEGGTHGVTSAGFDNFILASDDRARVGDAIAWAILNRKRKIKHSIQFDENPDAFYTVDCHGRIYDVNRKALEGTTLSPRTVVTEGLTIQALQTLPCFGALIQPHIVAENRGKVFNQTVEEGDSIYQIATRVHNLRTLGLVATIIQTDVTRTMYVRTLDIMLNSITMLSQRDNYTAGHSSRVFFYSRLIAREAGLERNLKFIRSLYPAAVLHDIGKIGVRDNILLKPGKLASEEFAELSTHSVKGVRMLQHYEFFRDALDLVRSHHERPDGKGYPDKLRGNRIPRGASIIAVADSFDAMTSNRPYRNSLGFDRAVEEIREFEGVQHDREISEIFLSFITPAVVEEARAAAHRPLSAISEQIIKAIVH